VTPDPDPFDGAVGAVGALVGATTGVGETVVPAGGAGVVPVVGLPGGAVVDGVAGATVTTKNPVTLFPVTWPGAESLTNVYTSDPL
jgi:hypothetical protein